MINKKITKISGSHVQTCVSGELDRCDAVVVGEPVESAGEQQLRASPTLSLVAGTVDAAPGPMDGLAEGYTKGVRQ